MMQAEELELVVCGSRDVDFNVGAIVSTMRGLQGCSFKQMLKSMTRLVGCTPAHPSICYFWEVVESMDAGERRQLLRFITGSERMPVASKDGAGLVLVLSDVPTDMYSPHRLIAMMSSMMILYPGCPWPARASVSCIFRLMVLLPWFTINCTTRCAKRRDSRLFKNDMVD